MTILRLVLGDQLSRGLSALKDVDRARDVVLMVEVAEEATCVRHHKQKIVLVLAAMRRFADTLRAAAGSSGRRRPFWGAWKGATPETAGRNFCSPRRQRVLGVIRSAVQRGLGRACGAHCRSQTLGGSFSFRIALRRGPSRQLTTSKGRIPAAEAQASGVPPLRI